MYSTGIIRGKVKLQLGILIYKVISVLLYLKYLISTDIEVKYIPGLNVLKKLFIPGTSRPLSSLR